MPDYLQLNNFIGPNLGHFSQDGPAHCNDMNINYNITHIRSDIKIWANAR